MKVLNLSWDVDRAGLGSVKKARGLECWLIHVYLTLFQFADAFVTRPPTLEPRMAEGREYCYKFWMPHDNETEIFNIQIYNHYSNTDL